MTCHTAANSTLSRQQQPPWPPSLATNASRGVSHSILAATMTMTTYPLPRSKHKQRGLSSGVRHCMLPQWLDLALVVTTPSLACIDSNHPLLPASACRVEVTFSVTKGNTTPSLALCEWGCFLFCSWWLKAPPPPLSLKHEWGHFWFCSWQLNTPPPPCCKCKERVSQMRATPTNTPHRIKHEWGVCFHLLLPTNTPCCIKHNWGVCFRLLLAIQSL